MNVKYQAVWPFSYIYPNITKVKAAEPFTKEELSPFQELGVSICYAFDKSNPQGGATIAYRKAGDFANTKMVEVAVAYCSKYDTFTKSIGRAAALKLFHSGKTILVPARTGNDDEWMIRNLRDMFWYSIT